MAHTSDGVLYVPARAAVLGAMSQENVELVEAIYNAWKSGVSAREFIHPELEYVNPPDGGGSRHAGIGRRNLAGSGTCTTVWRSYGTGVDAGDDVVVLATLAGTSRGAGVPVDIDQGYRGRSV